MRIDFLTQNIWKCTRCVFDTFYLDSLFSVTMFYLTVWSLTNHSNHGIAHFPISHSATWNTLRKEDDFQNQRSHGISWCYPKEDIFEAFNDKKSSAADVVFLDFCGVIHTNLKYIYTSFEKGNAK